jgi:hypothetical protein
MKGTITLPLAARFDEIGLSKRLAGKASVRLRVTRCVILTVD